MTTTKEQTMDDMKRWSKEGEFADALQNGTTIDQQLEAARATIAQRDAMIRQLGENAATAAKEYAATIAQQGEELARLREALEWIKAHAIKLRKGTDDWFELVEIEAAATTALESPAECPSCGGLNTSCPDGCGRDPKTGELNGTRLESPKS